MSLSDVVFKELFETLNSSLENDIDLNLKTTASPENHWDLCPEDELLERITKEKPSIATHMEEVIKTDTGVVLARLANQRIAAKKSRELRIEKLKRERSSFELRCDNASKVCEAQFKVLSYRLDKQKKSASRRLQELLFECIGELHKSILRASIRVDYHQKRVDDMIEKARLNFFWRRFLELFERDSLNKVKMDDVLPTMAIDSFLYGTEESSVAQNSVRNPLIHDIMVPNPEFEIIASDIKSRINQQVKESVPDGKTIRICRAVEVRHREAKTRKPNTKDGSKSNALFMEGSTSSSIDKILSRVVVNDRGKDSTPREYRRKIHKSVPVHSSFGLETLLSSKIVNYLCLTGDNNSKRMISAADSRIYYCLEELLQASGDSTGPVDGCESARVLAKLYHCDTKFSDIVDSDVQLAKYVVDHRQIKSQADDHNIKVVRSLPGVVRIEIKATDVRHLHFVPASLLQLIQTSCFSDLLSSDSLPEDSVAFLRKRFLLSRVSTNVISNLYILASPEASDVSPCTMESHYMKPLPKMAIEELIMTYIVRGKPEKGEALSSVKSLVALPEMEIRSENPYLYCIVYAPTVYSKHAKKLGARQSRVKDDKSDSDIYYNCIGTTFDPNTEVSSPVEWKTVSAILVQYIIAQEPTHGDSSSQKKKQDYSEALCGFCHWRACTAPALNLFSSKPTCECHSLIKKFLDAKGKKNNSESLRFLPKLTTTNGKACVADINTSASNDLRVIKDASSLLQELSTGKLSKTIVAFCNRAASSSTLSGKNTADAPMKSKLRKLEATAKKLRIRQKIIVRLFNTEKAATTELKNLVASGSLSAVDIASLRRELRSVENERISSANTNFESELELSHRKCRLFRADPSSDDRRIAGSMSMKELSIKDPARRKKSIRPSSATSTKSRNKSKS